MPRPILFSVPLEDRQLLRDAIRKNNTPEAVRRHARIVLALAEPGTSPREVARTQFTSRVTVSKIRDRYLAQGVASVFTPTPIGRPGITPAIKSQVLALGESSPSLTISAIANQVGISVGSVSMILKRRDRGRRQAKASGSSAKGAQGPDARLQAPQHKEFPLGGTTAGEGV